MLIVNADDFCRTRVATERAVACYKQGRITSTSARVFMEDSERAADLAGVYRMDSGLLQAMRDKQIRKGLRTPFILPIYLDQMQRH